MLKEIRYKGVSLTPSDYECTDGELMYSDGITIEGGEQVKQTFGRVLCLLGIQRC